MRFVDLTGEKFGHLTVIKRAEDYVTPSGKKYVRWECKCDCGKYTKVESGNLKKGQIKSCGCRQGSLTHNHSKERIYKTWKNMKQRCLNPKNNNYNLYGGKGIKIFENWINDFQAFYEWSMLNGYSDDLTIDRINSNGDYEPDNCRWVSMKTQANNTSRNHMITFNGETLTISQMAEKYKINPRKLRDRLYKLNWTIEKALSTP